MLAEAGIGWIQPGIESIDTHILRLMGKGVTALQNIQILKYCAQFGVYPTWNLLTGFPGEKPEDYQQIEDTIYTKVPHLPPPDGHFPFTLQRFSPYFRNPGEYGIVNVRPAEAYRFVYPLPDSRLRNLAYTFTFECRQDMQPPDYEEELTRAVGYWIECYERGETLFSQSIAPDAILIEDGRSNARIASIILRGAQKDIYEYCDQIRGFSTILSHFREQYGQYPIRERDLKDFLEEMIFLNLMVCEKNKYLSLAISLEYRSVIGQS
jgi:hypothetical protein